MVACSLLCFSESALCHCETVDAKTCSLRSQNGASLDVVCIPSNQRSEAHFLCECVCPNHSNSSTGLQHQQQQQCSFTPVVPSPGTALGKPCSCCGGQDVSHSSSNTVDIILSGDIMQFLFIILIDKLPLHSRRDWSSTVFGFLMPCWYSYSYHNKRYIFGQGGYDLLEKLETNSRTKKKEISPTKTSQ